MESSYKNKIEQARESKVEINRLFKNLKKRRPKNLDDKFHAAHDEVFDKIDCLACANCCKTTSPIFRDVDIKRISKRLKMNVLDFQEAYLKVDEDGDWVLQSSPCTFLGEDNHCAIYEFRPLACKEFPHTDRKRMVQIMDLTANNAQICPGVAGIALKLLKESV